VAQRRHHYERAFEAYLRLRRVPYVAVDEARKALLPDGAGLRLIEDEEFEGGPRSLKSFDFVLYGPERNLLVDIKGRKVARRMGGRSSIREAIANRDGDGGGLGGGGGSGGSGGAGAWGAGGVDAEEPEIAQVSVIEPPKPGSAAVRRGRLESWVTQEDVDSLRTWERLFGAGFVAALVFVYWCDEQPPDGLFQEVFDFQGRWYALRAITREDYVGAMKPRSARWRTVDLPASAFERLSQPFAPGWIGEQLGRGGGTNG
jgi:hypothetical protein